MKGVADLLSRPVPRLDNRKLRHFVQSFLNRRAVFLNVATRKGSPLYVVDTELLKARSRKFRDTFWDFFRDISVYYALKSNSHPVVAKTLLKTGLGLDVSSGVELSQALAYGATDIIFSGPGKCSNELELAASNSLCVTVMIDSFGELDRLEQIAARSRTPIRAGVRLTTDENGIWRKFGIPLTQLSVFWDQAEKCEWVQLNGLQFHISWNLDPNAQVSFLERLGRELRTWDKNRVKKIRFVDIGGGFWPEEGEWLQAGATSRGTVHKALGNSAVDGLAHFDRPATSLEGFARRLSIAINNELPDSAQQSIYLEPGRWLSHGAMHILLRVVDCKSSDIVITDGGTNAVGWERFESDFFPVINLSKPGIEEHKCLVAGSLCTPHDLWGYSYFGKGIENGDVLLVPNQGAYTYSLRQEFIKPLPKSVTLNGDILGNSVFAGAVGEPEKNGE